MYLAAGGAVSIMRHNRGFTLVELVITLVLIGILSAVGIGLLANPASYSATLGRDQFVSSALLAHKQALANTSETMALSVAETGDQWCFRVSTASDAGCSPGQTGARTADREGAVLKGNPGTFYFQGRRRVDSDGDPIPPGSSAQLRFVSSGSGGTHRACVSASGFAYAGDCVSN